MSGMSDFSILYLHTAPLPRMLGTDAVYQEVQWLQDHFSGESMTLFPLNKPNSSVPTFLYGWHKLKRLRAADQQHAINHIFSPGLIGYPILRVMSRPRIYSITATLDTKKPPRRKHFFKQLAAIVVNNQHNYDVIEKWGFENVHMIPTGIDIQPFSKQRLELGGRLHLLMASAPWEKSQFASKGLDLLLAAAKEIVHLHLTFLWRGHLVDDLHQRLQALNLEERVKVINERVDIAKTLQSVHGTILLSQFPELVKSYPHSLIESLLCGKPVITSATIPMAAMIEQSGCGIVQDEFSLSNLKQSLVLFEQRYDELVASAHRIDPAQFDQREMINRMEKIYRRIL